MYYLLDSNTIQCNEIYVPLGNIECIISVYSHVDYKLAIIILLKYRAR